MKTAIEGSWVVGYDGNTHVVLEDGVVVFEDDEISWSRRKAV